MVLRLLDAVLVVAHAHHLLVGADGLCGRDGVVLRLLGAELVVARERQLLVGAAEH